MFVERLTKDQVITLSDRLGLFGENGAIAYENYFLKNADFVMKLDEKKVKTLKQKLGLNQNASNRSLVHQLTINNLVHVHRARSGEIWVDFNQFTPKGNVWTFKNIGKNDRDLVEANCYFLEDFTIRTAQATISERDLKNMNAIYRSFMIETFGEEYVNARNNYNSVQLAKRGFRSLEPYEKSWLSDVAIPSDEILVKKEWKWQIAKKIKELSKSAPVEEK